MECLKRVINKLIEEAQHEAEEIQLTKEQPGGSSAVQTPVSRGTERTLWHPDRSCSITADQDQAQELAFLHFDGERPKEPCLRQVEVAVLYNGWDQHEAAAHLTLALEGVAQQVSTEQPLKQQWDIEQLMEISAG